MSEDRKYSVDASWYLEAKEECERLREINAELLKALKKAALVLSGNSLTKADLIDALVAASSAISKAEGKE